MLRSPAPLCCRRTHGLPCLADPDWAPAPARSSERGIPWPSQAASHPAARRWAFSKNEVASLAIARSMAPLANQMEGKMPEPLKRSHIKREAAQARAYSQAVITEGRRTIWLAGQVAIEDSSGRALDADFDGQVREVFARLGRTLEEAGASLADMVTMTVIAPPRAKT